MTSIISVSEKEICTVRAYRLLSTLFFASLFSIGASAYTDNEDSKSKLRIEIQCFDGENEIYQATDRDLQKFLRKNDHLTLIDTIIDREKNVKIHMFRPGYVACIARL